MPSGVTPIGVSNETFFRIQQGNNGSRKKYLSLVAVQDVSRGQGLERLLNRGCWTKTIFASDRLGINLCWPYIRN